MKAFLSHKIRASFISINLLLSAMALSAFGQGLLREYWSGINGSTVSSLTGNANYPNNPTSRNIISTFEGPNNIGDNYGSRIRGCVLAPTTGAYTFWIASDDNSELWLSTSEDPAAKVLIASVTSWTNAREWTKFSSQQSAAKNLIAGQKYYIEVLHKDETGGDNIAVGWQGPGITGDTERPIPGSRLRPLEAGLLREVWNGISGTSVSNLTSSSSYPNSPSASEQIYSFKAPSNTADNYGQCLRGYVVPPTTGSYTFWIASDDNSELWLSTSANPADKTLIASVNGYTNSREWTKYPSQQSSSRTLTAGQKYYIEVLHKEGTGGDNCAVGWQGPGISGETERPIPTSRLLPWTGGTQNYSLTISNNGNGSTIPSGTLTVEDNTVVSISATPVSGYAFSNWSVTSGTATITSPTSVNTTVTVAGSNATIRANFVASTCQLSVTAVTGGSITTPATSPVTVPSGVPTTITAAANTGYTFTGWSVVSGTATIANVNAISTTVTMTSGSATVRANFARTTYSLTVLNDGYGVTSPSGTSTVYYGSATPISANPTSGYQFLNWTITSGSATIANPTSAATSVTLYSNATIRANFTLATTNGSSVTYTQISSPVNVIANNTVVLTLPFTAPSNGYITVTATGLYGTNDNYTHEQRGVECFITLNSTTGGTISEFSEKMPMTGSAQYVNETVGFQVTAGANTLRLIASPRTRLYETIYKFVKCKMTVVFSTQRM